MNQKLKTSIAFARNIFVTGAFAQTSSDSEVEICRYVSDKPNTVVVEFGMGHGNITREILSRISPTSKLYAFEVKTSFCEHVRENIQDDRLIIVNDSAEFVKKYVKEDVNSLIASIPYSFFSKEKGLQIIQDAHDLLVDDSYYSQVLYTKFNFKKFEEIFEDCKMKKISHFPNEYIYHCRKDMGMVKK